MKKVSFRYIFCSGYVEGGLFIFIQTGLSQNALSGGTKGKNTVLSSKQEAAEHLISLIREETKELSEEDKKEIDYLKKYNPMLYQRYLRIRKMDEDAEEQEDLLSWNPLQEIIDMQPTFAKDA